MALLAWATKEKVFLKIQEGTGDALSWEDVQKGYESYVLWEKFRVGDLDLDGELNLEPIDGGVLLGQEMISARDALKDCFQMAFGREAQNGDYILLADESDAT